MKRNSYILILAGILLCPFATFAQTTYTLVTSNSEWNNANTWSPLGIPGAGDFVIIVDKNVRINNSQHTIGGFNLTAGTIFFEGAEPMLTVTDSAVWYEGEFDGGNGANGGNTVNSNLIIAQGATLILDNDATPETLHLYEGLTLTNKGTIRHIGSSNLGIRGLSVLKNEGLYDIVSDADFTGESFSGGTFINTSTGIFRKSGGTDVTSFNIWWKYQNMGGTIDAQSGSIHFISAGTFDGVNFIAGANGAIDFRSSAQIFKGTLSGSPTGTVRLSGSAINIDSSGVTLDFQGTGFQFSNGSLTGGGTLTIPEGSLLRLVPDPVDPTPSLTLTNETTILNLGTIRQESNTTFSGSGISVVDNRSLFEIVTDADFSGGSGGADFKNTGILKKNGGTDITLFNTWWSFQNQGGTIDAQSGSIHFSGSGSFIDVNFIAANNAAIDFRGSTHIFKGTLSGSPSGSVRLSGSTINIDTSGVTLDFQGTGFQFSNGSLTGGGTLTIAEGSLLRLVADPVDPTPSLTLTNETTILNLGTIRQESNTTFSGSGISVVDNRSLFEIVTDADFSGGSGGADFKNTGILKKNGGTDITLFNTWWSFQNQGGTIDAQIGSIHFTGSGSFIDVNFIAANNAAIDFRASTHIFKGTLSGSPAGTVRLSGSTINIDTSGVTIDFQGTGFQFSKGTLTGGGILTIPEGSLLRLVTDPVDPTPYLTLTNETTILNLGTIRQESNTNFSGSGICVVDNRSLFEIATDADFWGGSGGGTFLNTGIFRKSGGNDVSLIGSIWWRFFNQSGGIIDAASGELEFTSNITNAQGGIIQGVASVNVPNGFTNNGIISPGNSPGMLTYIGDFLPSATSVLQVQLGGLTAGAQHDQLVVTGKAALNGTLDVSLINGYIPSVGDSFIVLTTSGIISQGFANLTATSGLYFDVKINANNVTLKVDSIGSVVSVNSLADSNGFKLRQNYPNPFSSKTVIDYLLPEGRHRVSLKVFDISGNEVVTLINEEKSAGSYQAEFNAKDLSNGIYYYKLQTGVFSETKKMILMK